MSNWTDFEARTLKANVTDLIRQAIIKGDLPADSELNQAQIAEQLGTSRGPVREALGRLEQEGLIKNVPYKGVVITALTPDYVEELYSLRGALETFAVSCAVDKLTAEGLKKLEHLIKEMDEAAAVKDERTLGEIDLVFHRTIIDMAQHELLKKTWRPLEIGLQRCLYKRHEIYPSLDQVVGSHPAIVEAMAARDSETAMDLMREHILDAGEKLREQMEEELKEEAAQKETAMEEVT